MQSVTPESQPSLIQHEIQSKLIVVENEASASKTDTDMSMFRQSTSPRICKGTQFYCILQSLDASHHHDSEERYSIECFYKTTFDLLCKQTIFCEGDMYMYNQSSVPQPEFIVVSNIKPSGILANEGDLSIIQRRLIVTSSDILYKLWISCREGDQYLLYLHLQHNIPSFICANEGESVVVCPNISSVILRDEPEILLHSANPNIDQQDASSASTSSHHLYTVPPQNYLPLEIFTLQKYLQPQELTLNMARPSFTIVKPTTEILTLQIYLHSQAGTHHVNNSVVAL